MSRLGALTSYFTDLVTKYDALAREKVVLQNAQARLQEVNLEISELIADAQEALDKYNLLQGTSFTLAQMRKYIAGDKS